jgi:hypothetical protein
MTHAIRSSLSFLLVGALSAAAYADPSTKITSCPATITAPGTYVLTTDCTVMGPNPAITVSASNVHLVLAGHTLTGPGGVALSASSSPLLRRSRSTGARCRTSLWVSISKGRAKT